MVYIIIARDGLILRAEPTQSSQKIALMPHGTRVRPQDSVPSIRGEANGRQGYWIAVVFNGSNGWAFSQFMEEQGPKVFWRKENQYFVVRNQPGIDCFADDDYRETTLGSCFLSVYKDDKLIADFPWVAGEGWLDADHIYASKGDAHAGVWYAIRYSLDIRSGATKTLKTFAKILPLSPEANSTLTVCHGDNENPPCCTAIMKTNSTDIVLGSDSEANLLWRLPGIADVNPITSHEFGIEFTDSTGKENKIELDPATCQPKDQRSGTSSNSKITRSAQVAAGAFAPVFALPTSWGPDVVNRHRY